jgi:hypothetical protein
VAMKRKPIKKDKSINDDGWNNDYFSDMGLNEWLTNCYRLKYEIESCRRGSYFSDKDTGEGMLENIKSLKEELEEIIETIEGDV